jgi:hypothetical protein
MIELLKKMIYIELKKQWAIQAKKRKIEEELEERRQKEVKDLIKL